MRNRTHNQNAVYQIGSFDIGRVAGCTRYFFLAVDSVNWITNKFLCHIVKRRSDDRLQGANDRVFGQLNLERIVLMGFGSGQQLSGGLPEC